MGHRPTSRILILSGENLKRAVLVQVVRFARYSGFCILVESLMNNKILLAPLIILFPINCLAAPETVVSNELLRAIHIVETGGSLKSPLGDDGRARGPLQIWKSYHSDALEYDPSIGGTYADCDSLEYSKKIVRAYMRRYAPKGASAKDIAMLHNGGASILKRKDSGAFVRALAYWEKVRKHLAKP